jgi:hypothetical protein
LLSFFIVFQQRWRVLGAWSLYVPVTDKLAGGCNYLFLSLIWAEQIGNYQDGGKKIQGGYLFGVWGDGDIDGS